MRLRKKYVMHIGIRIDECRDECTLHSKQYSTSKYAFDNFARKQAQHSEDKQRLTYILPHEVAPLNHSDSRRKTYCIPTQVDLMMLSYS